MTTKHHITAFNIMSSVPGLGVTMYDAGAYNRLLRQSLPFGFDFDPVVALRQGERVAPKHLCKDVGNGQFSFASVVVPKNEVLPVFDNDIPVHIAFDGDIFIPTLYCDKQRVWMSLTPMEMITQRLGLQLAKGNVLIAGCGLGWFANQCLKKPEVTGITVVDCSEAVIDEYGSLLKHKHKEIRLHACDAYEFATHVENLCQFDTVLFDIWKNWGEAEKDARFSNLKNLCEDLGIECWGWGYDIEEIEALCDECLQSTKQLIKGALL